MSAPPGWLERLANAAARRMHPVDVMPPLGCHYYHNRALDQWEVTLFASRTEIVGGELDGQLRSSRLTVDLAGVQALFDEVHAVRWQAQSIAPDDDLGPHVAIEGLVGGQEVWLRILAEAPPRFEKGRNVITYDLRLEDVW